MIDRRTLLSSTATGIGGLLTGTIYLQSTDTAQASVSMGNLNVTGDRKTTTNGYINDLTATISGKWSYELPGGTPSNWIITLQVSDGDAWYTVGESSGDANYKQYNDSYTVSGSILDTEGFSTEFFAAPSPGKQISVDLPVRVTFEVLDSNDTALASTSIEDTATVTVGQEAIDASLYGEVNGEGSISID